MTESEETKPYVHKKINDTVFLAALEQRNALYRGVFASKKFASDRSQLPSPPNTVTAPEKMFWFIGVHVGMDQLSESDAAEPYG